MTLDELRSAITANGEAWMETPRRRTRTARRTSVEHGDGWDFHSPLGFRLAQVVHHGTDHRSQICTALTSLGIEPPGIDLWGYGEATNRTRPEYLTARPAHGGAHGEGLSWLRGRAARKAA